MFPYNDPFRATRTLTFLLGVPVVLKLLDSEQLASKVS
jgi:hypothetical protein